MTRRTDRIGSLIRSLIAEAIQMRLSDPRIAPITSITRVEVSADLSLARIFVSVLAPVPQRRLCVEALQSAAGHLRRLIGPELSVRKTPMLHFELDESVQRSIETVETIDRVMRELGEVPVWEREVPDAEVLDEVPDDEDAARESRARPPRPREEP